MTDEHFEICQRLGDVKYLPGSWDKKMAHSLSAMDFDDELTAKQIEWMYRLLYTYRKQLPMTYNKYKSNPFCAYRKNGWRPQTIN